MEERAMMYKKNWEQTQEKFKNYWKQQNTGRPLMCVIARKPEIEPVSYTHLTLPTNSLV